MIQTFTLWLILSINGEVRDFEPWPTPFMSEEKCQAAGLAWILTTTEELTKIGNDPKSFGIITKCSPQLQQTKADIRV